VTARLIRDAARCVSRLPLLFNRPLASTLRGRGLRVNPNAPPFELWQIVAGIVREDARRARRAPRHRAQHGPVVLHAVSASRRPRRWRRLVAAVRRLVARWRR
jgi:hypothetical protein